VRVSKHEAAGPSHPSRRRHSASKTRVNALMAPPQDEAEMDYCSLMLPFFATSAHCTSSRAMTLANSSAVVPAG
jgi:hypothetical protein